MFIKINSYYLTNKSLLPLNKEKTKTLLNTDILKAEDHLITLDQSGKIIWNIENNKIEAAQLIKGETITSPQLQLLNTQELNSADLKKIKNYLETWLNKHIQTILQPLLSLENIPVQGMVKGIAFQLFENFGFLYRKNLNHLIKDLTKEDRQLLSKRGVRLGAYYIYQRDMLKPVAISLRGCLWRIFNGDHPMAITPPAGNVSMTVDPKAPKDFYRIIGFPIFGTTAVRMDMVERINSAVYDGAVEGKYVFDPALASTIGVSVDALYLVLDDLGFKHEVSYEETPLKEGEETSTKKEIRTYHLKKMPIKPLRRKSFNHKNGKRISEKKKSKPTLDPNSPFAALKDFVK